MIHYRRDLFRLLEAALVGLFFVQAVRFLYGTLYAHLSGASLVSLTVDPATLAGQPGAVRLSDVQLELLAAGAALFAPVLSLFMGRLWFGPAVAAIAAAAGRVFMTANGATTLGVVGAGVTAGAAGLYLAVIAIRHPSILPPCLALGFAGDQLVRLYGSTLDVTWEASFLENQTLISLGLFLFAVLATVFERLAHNAAPPTDSPPPRGEIGGWNAFALGGLLYLEFAVLGLPNTVAHRSGLDYISVAPWLVGATLLPLAAEVRDFARRFLNMFDGQFRGWIWFLMLSALLVIGFRLQGPIAAGALIGAQLLVCLSFWWVVQPSASRINFSPLGVPFAILVFLLITGAEYFTFEYAFVRGIQEPFAGLLRAFRGLGWVVVIFSALLVGLPAILARKRLPWRGGPFTESLAALALVVMGAVLAGSLTRPIVATPGQIVEFRIATLNLHSGYSLYFDSNLPEVARQIKKSGAQIVLLQEVDTGRLISYGVDQSAWLARQLNMQVQYFATNEGLQGLAVLTSLPIEQAQGVLLTSRSKQTGVQFLRLRAPDRTVLDIYNTQLSLLFRGGDLSIQDQALDQTAQIQEILDLVEQNNSATNRTILGGTFNHTPGTDIYLFLSQRNYVDPFAGLQSEKAVTLRRINEPPVRVDYIWLHCLSQSDPSCVQPISVGVAPLPQSSHNLAVVGIALTGAGG